MTLPPAGFRDEQGVHRCRAQLIDDINHNNIAGASPARRTSCIADIVPDHAFEAPGGSLTRGKTVEN